MKNNHQDSTKGVPTGKDSKENTKYKTFYYSIYQPEEV